MALLDSQRAQFDGLVRSNKIVLFMKGNRRFPQCGFSATVVGVLDRLASDYKTVNILEDPALRDGMKEYSSWPTFPQLYVNGEFVGGCDIVQAMYASGELQKLLGGEVVEVNAPAVTISASAAKAFAEAAVDADGGVLRLDVDSDFRCDLHFGPKQPGDLEVASNGVTMYVGRGSAARADGIAIDFVDGPRGGAFKIDNPNEPAKVKSITAKALRAMLDSRKVELFDVRPEAERARAAIADAKPLDAAGQKALMALAKDTPIALHCHHGMRSRAAGDELIRMGFTNVYNLEGGIEAWSNDVDPSVPRY
jgi:monothiol glutaredoxin